MSVGLLSLSSQPNNNRVTINAIASYLNLVKGFGFAPIPGNQDANGYPVTTPATIIGSNPNMPSGYYGTFTLSWLGQGSMQILSAPPIVVTSGGTAIFEIGTNSGDRQSSNLSLTSQIAPSVVFAFGWNIQSISSGAGGVITINTKTNFVASGAGYSIRNSTVNITGANANTGANGTWVVTNLTASSFDLVGSTFTNVQASPAGQAILAAGNMSIRINNTGTFSGFSNLVWARTGDIAAINSGLYLDSALISQYQALAGSSGPLSSRAWLRFMDLSGVQANYEVDFSQRVPATAMSYGKWTPAGYYVGTITNTADAFTCSNPSASGGGAYVDGEMVIGLPSATNATVSPTLNVGARGAKPILLYSSGQLPVIWVLPSAPPPSPGTDVLQFTFQASWLTGGTPVVVNYSTVAGDTTISALSAHLNTFFGTQTTLTNAGINFTNPLTATGPMIIPPPAAAGHLTVTYTSGPAVISIGTMTTSRMLTTATAGSYPTFIYNLLLDAFIYTDTSPAFSTPFEILVEMCNRTNMHCWWNWGTTRGSFVTAVTQFFADSVTGLNSGLRFGNEAYNEVWNSSLFPYSIILTLGQTLGFKNGGQLSYTGLRTIQYAALAKTAWTGKGRSASDFYVMQMAQTFQVGVGNPFDIHQLKGDELVTTNTYYNTYGALNGTGTAVADYSVAGSRPVDITTVIGCAPYWGSPWFSSTAGNITGPITQHVPWLQASLDFTNGNTATAFTSLANQFNGTTTRSSGSSGAQVLASGANDNFYNFVFTSQEAQAAQYDAFRIANSIPKLGIMHYEGANQWAVGSNGTNGTNSATDTGPLITQITALQGSNPPWDVSPYTVSGTNNITELCNQVLNMIWGWKMDLDHNGNPANTGSYKGLITTYYFQALKTTSGANRETKPAQYGYQASIWGMFPTDFHLGNNYQNYAAISTWNT
jgi:hypothetical protein